MSPATVLFLQQIGIALGKLGASVMSLLGGADADEERAKLRSEGVVIDGTASDKAVVDAESHYPE